MGHNENRLLRFAFKYPANWHGYGTDQATVRAIRSLTNKGFLITNEFRQFRLALPDSDFAAIHAARRAS